MRAFIAIDLPETLREALGLQQATFRSACLERPPRSEEIRWTRPAGIHLTLKFLGDVPSDQLKPVTDALAGLGRIEPFSIEVKDFGFFPDARRPHVLWAGVAAPPELGLLAERIEAAMEKLGFPREKRRFTPHLTLARFKTPRPQPALESLLEREGKKTLGRLEVTEFCLFESKLSPGGAEYHKVARFPR